MVHHRYSSYLLGQMHREFDALKHEIAVTQLLPDFGEAFLNSATACLHIGDSERALGFAEQAHQAGPRYMDKSAFEFMISRERLRALGDMGRMEEARVYMNRCLELTQTPPLNQDTGLVEKVRQMVSDKEHWERSALLAALRKKTFAPNLAYRISDLELVFPDEWKVDQEGVNGTLQKPALLAVFSSQTIWDSKAKQPGDAAIHVFYSAKDEDMLMTAELFGKRCRAPLNRKARGKVDWSEDGPSIEVGRTVLSRWKFRTREGWPKVGVSITVARPDARLHLSLMCEQCATQLFWPQLESVQGSFTEQIFRLARV
jgi:hypothetical protein